MRVPVHPDDQAPYFERQFPEDEPVAFLRHYGLVFGDVFNPHMAGFWADGYGPSGTIEEWRNKNRWRVGIRHALYRLMAIADRHGFDLQPIQWADRYIAGAVAREPDTIVSLRYLFQRIYVRETGSGDHGWREYEELPPEQLGDLKPLGTGTDIGQIGETSDVQETAWPNVSTAAKTFCLREWHITRAANSGKLRSNGKKGRARRIDPADLIRWHGEQMNAPDSVDSQATVKRRMGRP